MLCVLGAASETPGPVAWAARVLVSWSRVFLVRWHLGSHGGPGVANLCWGEMGGRKFLTRTPASRATQELWKVKEVMETDGAEVGGFVDPVGQRLFVNWLLL